MIGTKVRDAIVEFKKHNADEPKKLTMNPNDYFRLSTECWDAVAWGAPKGSFIAKYLGLEVVVDGYQKEGAVRIE
jgi:hypothetical protein